jgi:RNA polymerase sigma factor (sigma-70 family)
MLCHLRRLGTQEGTRALSDAQLLERFLRSHDELAFEVLLWRHGTMVLDVCRRLLRHEQDAEDAFQATFLILVRKAATIGKRESLGSWLYKVAYRVACAARNAGTNQAPPYRVPAREVSGPAHDAEWRDLAPLLDEEVNRLPDKYRVPVVLCYLQGKTVDEAARQLGCPRGTIGTRLARARQRLRSRLAGRGVELGGAAFLGLLAQPKVRAAPSATLIAATLKAVTIPAAASARIVTLSQGVLKTMFLSRLKTAVAVVLLLAAFASGLGSLSIRMHAAEEPAGPQEPKPPARARQEAPRLKGMADRMLCTSCHAGLEQAPRPDRKGVVISDFDRDGWLDLFVTHEHGYLWQDYSLNLLHKPGARMALRGWGVAFDPEDDCRFAVVKDKLTLTVPRSVHALAPELGRMNAPRVLQEVEGDFIAQVKVSGEFPERATSMVEGRRPYHGAGLLVFQDNKNFARLERAGMIYGEKHYQFANFEARLAGKLGRQGDAEEHPLADADYYFRLERRGDLLIASVSRAGVHWDALAPLTARLSRRLLVGVIAGQNTSTGFSPTFSGYKLFRDGK